jgi:hypothetical protein
MSGLEGEAQDSGFLPTIVPIGGFHGAGKTSLIVAAARLLKGRGLRLAAVLNDQGAELVDTSFVEANGILAGQVAGGCFCCRLSELPMRPTRCAATCRRSFSPKLSATARTSPLLFCNRRSSIVTSASA